MNTSTTSYIALVAGMFGSEFNSKRVMGLAAGQMRPTEHDCTQCGKKPWGKDACACVPRIKTDCQKIGHNNSWYNRKGEKLGWGDFCTCDAVRVAKEMDQTDTFYLLYESAGFWDLRQSKLDPAAPGVGYVHSKMHTAIHAGTIYQVVRDDSDYVGKVEGVFHYLTRHAIIQLVRRK